MRSNFFNLCSVTETNIFSL
uniref:Uncharacterized protein n=1 Tax=Arundo donax TaxID=35708 RepID=A0A0A8YMZ4_ARUDO